LPSENEFDALGSSVECVGDRQGDGYDDVVLGAPGWSNPEVAEGQFSLWYGAPVGLIASEWTFETNQEGAYALRAAAAGDVQADGWDDLVVTAPLYDAGAWNSGIVWLFTGTSTGFEFSPTWSFSVPQADARTGQARPAAGDVNGDGASDVLISASGLSNPELQEGAVYLFLGTPTDTDGDGYVDSQDCNPLDPATYPGAPESCDGADNDCDGALPIAESDSDEDGAWACAGDCDDSDATVFPGAEDADCDGIDADCDGLDGGGGPCGDDDDSATGDDDDSTIGADDDSAPGTDDDSASGGDDSGAVGEGEGDVTPSTNCGCVIPQDSTAHGPVAACLAGLAAMTRRRDAPRRRPRSRKLRPAVATWPLLLLCLFCPPGAGAGEIGVVVNSPVAGIPGCDQFRVAANLCASVHRHITPPISWELAIVADQFGYVPDAGGTPAVNPWTGLPFASANEYTDHLVCAPWRWAGIRVAPIMFPYAEFDQANYWPTSVQNEAICLGTDFLQNGYFNLLQCGAAAVAGGYPTYGMGSSLCSDVCGPATLSPPPWGGPQFDVVTGSTAPTGNPPTWCDCYRFDQLYWGGGHIPMPGPGLPTHGIHVKAGTRWHAQPYNPPTFVAPGNPAVDFYTWSMQVAERYDGDGIDDAYDDPASICHEDDPASGYVGPVRFDPSLACPLGGPSTIFSTDCAGRPAAMDPIPAVLSWELMNELESNTDYRWPLNQSPGVPVVGGGGTTSGAEGYAQILAYTAAGGISAACANCAIVNGGMIRPPDAGPTSPVPALPYWIPPIPPWPASAATPLTNFTFDTSGFYGTNWWFDWDLYSELLVSGAGDSLDILAFHSVNGQSGIGGYFDNSLTISGGGDPASAPMNSGVLGFKPWLGEVFGILSPAIPQWQSFWANEVTLARSDWTAPGFVPYAEGDQSAHLLQGLAYYFAHARAPRQFVYAPLFDQNASSPNGFAGLVGPAGSPPAAQLTFAMFGRIFDASPTVYIHAPVTEAGTPCEVLGLVGPSGEIWGELDAGGNWMTRDPALPNVLAAEYEFELPGGTKAWIYWNEDHFPASPACDTRAPMALAANPCTRYYDALGTLIAMGPTPVDPNSVASPIVACNDWCGAARPLCP
jgi:hypothetical protein